MNLILTLITREAQPASDPPNGTERYFRLEADLPSVPLRGETFHFIGMPGDCYDVVVCGIEWEVSQIGLVTPNILLANLNLYADPKMHNEPGEVEHLLRSGWREVDVPYTREKNSRNSHLRGVLTTIYPRSYSQSATVHASRKTT